MPFVAGLFTASGLFFRGLFTFIIVGVITRVLAAIGIGYLTYVGLDKALTFMFDNMALYFSYLPVSILQLFRLAEVDTALSLIASAMVSRAVIKMSATFLGVRT